MKILLLVPPYIDKKNVSGSRFDIKVEDLGLEYLSSYLKANGFIDTEIIHCQLEGFNCNDLKVILETMKPDIVGISISFESTDYLGGIETAKIVKHLNQNIKVFAGGHAATFLYETLMKECLCIDYVVFGEGEISTLSLVQAIESKLPINQVNGIAYRSNGSILRTNKQKLIDNLDLLPFADRSIYNKFKPEFALIESSRGCWGKCKFCSVPAFFNNGIGKIWRTRSSKSLIEEMENIIKNWNVNKFDFVDDNFLGVGLKGKEKIQEFYSLVKGKNLQIEFNIACRVESVNLNDLLLLKEIGLKKIYVGIESGSNKTLIRYGKNTTNEDNRKAIEVLKKLGIDAKLCLIIFDPWMTEEELLETIEFLIEMDCFQLFHWTSILNSYKPYNGTELQKQLFKDYNLLNPDKTFTYTIVDKKVNEIRNICRFVSGAVKYLYESLKDDNELTKVFKTIDMKLSKPLTFYIRYLLKQDQKDLTDNTFYINVFYRMLNLFMQKTTGEDIYEKIEQNFQKQIK